MKKILFALLLSIPSILLGNTSLGVFGSASQQLYKETDVTYTVFPNIIYQGEHFFLRFPQIGYRFLPNNAIQNITIGLAYDSSGLDPDDSDDENIRKLDERKASVMAFTSYRLGPITAKLAQDISGEHEGYYGELSAAYPISMGSWRVIPSVSYRHIGTKMSNYLFGVSQSESDLTNNLIESYSSSATSFTKYGLIGVYPVLKNTNLMIGINRTTFNNEILASSIVDDNKTTSFFTSLIYRF